MKRAEIQTEAGKGGRKSKLCLILKSDQREEKHQAARLQGNAAPYIILSESMEGVRNKAGGVDDSHKGKQDVKGRRDCMGSGGSACMQARKNARAACAYAVSRGKVRQPRKSISPFGPTTSQRMVIIVHTR